MNSEQNVSRQLLKDGVNELYDRSKISSTLKTEAEDYIDELSDDHFEVIDYIDFNQDDSVGCTFTDASKSVTYGGSGEAELLTNSINIGSATIRTLKLKATNENVTWQISSNGTTWYNIDSYNLDESVTAAFYLKVKFSIASTIKGLVIVYEK